MLDKGLSGCIVENRIHVVPPTAIGDADAHRGLDVRAEVQAEALRAEVLRAEVLPAEVPRGG